jgi:DNA-binding transcriptional MerR regulator
MSTLTIADAARASGLSAHALRYYERAGLLDPIDRDASGHRRYSPEDLEDTARNLELIDWKINLYREKLETP